MKKQAQVLWRWTNPPIDRIVISQLEKAWKVTFPEDYVQCALVNHGGKPKPHCFDFPGHPGAVFNTLLGYIDATSDDEDPSITQMYEAVKDSLPERVFSFADDPFGNLICFDYRGSKSQSPTILFWDHEVANAKRAMSPVCSTFSELLEKLYEPDD